MRAASGGFVALFQVASRVQFGHRFLPPAHEGRPVVDQ
jgi:hypothetical protein